MKRLKFLVGGQPFRSTDFELIQSNSVDPLKDLLATSITGACIISGLNYDFSIEHNPGDSFTIPGGAIWDLTEVCQVNSATFNYLVGHKIYLRQLVTDSEPRLIAGSQQNVFSEKGYQLLQTDNPVSGDIELSVMDRAIIGTHSSLKYMEDRPIALEAGFQEIIGDGLYCYYNMHGGRTIQASFNANSGSGVVAYLPQEHRPNRDITGWFLAGSVIAPLFIIASTGAVQIQSAGAGNKVINFSYNVGITTGY